MDVLQPTPSGARYPLREPGPTLGSLVGQTAEHVVGHLGRPDSRSVGRYWLADGAASPPHVERNPDGSMRRVAVFGPVPTTIPVGEPYEVWTYHNVRGHVWMLYVAASRDPSGGRRRCVAEVTSYPEGAVF